MISNVKNQNDAYKLKSAFTAWLDDERGIGCTDNDIAVTSDTIDNFITACREIGETSEVEAFSPEHQALEGGKVYELMGTQRQRGESRRDLYILDAGNYRLVYAG